jgi:peroxiredoxin Q/BCP
MTRFLQGATAALAMMLAGAALAAEPPAVGSPAPAFRLQDQAGAWHALSDYKGKWVVLYFYPKDNTPGCTTQACEFRDNIFAYREMGAVILGVSVDDVASHKAFSEQHSLPFPILADSEKTTATAYGTLMNYKDMVLSQRDTYIIDPQGRIAKHYVKVDPKGHSELVLADLKQLMAAAPNG